MAASLSDGAAGAEVLQLNDANFQAEISKYDVVMVNFYADWCRFCQMLKPVWQDAADLMADDARIKLARVDCEAADTARSKEQYHISKCVDFKSCQVSVFYRCVVLLIH